MMNRPHYPINILPVELLYYVFDHLWAHDIFYAFFNLSDYIDGVLVNYDRYLVNFRHVLKSQFDITCQYIRPHRVIALTLSDDEETPDQSALFFSLFDIEQFINLRSFDMTSIGDNAFKHLLNLHQLKHLSSIELPRLFPPYNRPFHDAIKQHLLPQLSRLLVYNPHYLLNDQLPHIRYLTLMYCCCLQLPHVLHRVPNLHSLDITLSLNVSTDWTNKIILPLTHLKRLVLNIYSEQIKMLQIEQLLSKMPNLKHFELVAEVYKSFINNERWQLLVSHLITFNFRFILLDFWPNSSITHLFDSFRSPFWLEHKRWFVAFDEQCRSIFTVPRFAPRNLTYSPRYQPLLCSSPDLCFDRYIRGVNLSLPDPLIYRFTNITSLVFNADSCCIDSASLPFSELVQCIPHLDSLSFCDISPLVYLSNDVILKKIRTLHMRYTFVKSNTRPDFDINQLCTVYPRLERLNTWLTCPQDLFVLIDQFKYLSIAKLEFNCSASISTNSFQLSQVTRKWFINNSRRLKTNKNFTYKIVDGNIHLWMSSRQLIDEDERISETCLNWYSSGSCCLQ